jgi:hypothetical protein
VNLKAKIYLYVNSTTQRCPYKIIKIFLLEDFFRLPPVSTTPVVHLEPRISPQIFEKNRNGPFLLSCGDIGFKKILCLVLIWKSGLKVRLLPLGSSSPLQTILLSDLVGCDSPLQIVMAFSKFFFKFDALESAIIVSSGLSHPTGWAALPSENISWFLFQGQKNPLRI